MTTEIRLSRGKIALIDDNIADEIGKYKWCAYKDCNNKNETWYVKRSKGGEVGSLLMHRFIMEIVLERKLERNEYVDHIDHNGLNNQFNNLRIANPSENAANRISRIKKTSQYKGVYFNKEKGKFQAQIQLNYIKINLGYFEDEIEAAEVYDLNALSKFGEYAHINFPDKLRVRKVEAGLTEATA